MKTTRTLHALVTMLTAALITLSPTSSRGGVLGPDSHPESESRSIGSAQECPTKRPATQQGCGAGAVGQTTTTVLVTSKTESYQLHADEPDDTSGALLEELVYKEPGQPEKVR